MSNVGCGTDKAAISGAYLRFPKGEGANLLFGQDFQKTAWNNRRLPSGKSWIRQWFCIPASIRYCTTALPALARNTLPLASSSCETDTTSGPSGSYLCWRVHVECITNMHACILGRSFWSRIASRSAHTSGPQSWAIPVLNLGNRGVFSCQQSITQARRRVFTLILCHLQKKAKRCIWHVTRKICSCWEANWKLHERFWFVVYHIEWNRATFWGSSSLITFRDAGLNMYFYTVFSISLVNNLFDLLYRVHSFPTILWNHLMKNCMCVHEKFTVGPYTTDS